MKIRVTNPKDAAATTGGCTFEVAVGWWTYSEQPEAAKLGKSFNGERDALYIPTLQKTGEPVDEAEIEKFKSKAMELGFDHISGASGMWILSGTGDAQVEYIWICWAKSVGELVRAKMSELAQEIKNATNQDCVAWESCGKLNFTACV